MLRLLAPLLLAACTGGGARPEGFDAVACADLTATTCVEVAGGDTTLLQESANSLSDGMTLVLGEGTFMLDNSVTLRGGDGVTLIGQGIDSTILDFSSATTQGNGVDVVGDDFTIRSLTIQDSNKDGLRIEDSEHVTIQRVKVTWTGGPSPDNGAYGLYPVRVSDVLMEDSEAYNASDAGIYVGQCVGATVRNNIAKANVAGIEIENTQYADVYGNLAEDNTGGLLIFDLPGNPVVGRDIHVHDNVVRSNNRDNFAPGGTVQGIPAGTGTFLLASRRVELRDNTYEDNRTSDIAILSGLAIEPDPMAWAIQTADLRGDWEDLGLPVEGGALLNFATTEVLITGNSHSGSGTDPDGADLVERELGFLLSVVYGDTRVDDILYDAIEESAFHPTEATGNSNDNHICVHAESGATFASLDLETLGARAAALDFGSVEDLYRPAAPFAPFDCDALTAGPVVGPTAP